MVRKSVMRLEMVYHNEVTFGLTAYILWNLASFILIMWDKRRAMQGEWRIQERTFFLWAFAFGASGILLGMHVFRHKTRHKAFTIGMPMIWLMNIACGYFLWQLV